MPSSARPRVLPIRLDCCFDQGSGWQQIPVAHAFEGSGLRYALLEGSADIDPETGLLHVPTGRPHDGEVIRVQAEGAGGTAVTELTVTVEDDGQRAETTLSDRIEADGFTYMFDRPAPVGHFISGANGQGDPFVVGPVRLMGYTPAPGASGDRHVNGAMLNPPCTRDTGFDSRANGTYKEPLNAGRRLPLDLVPGDSLIVCHSYPGQEDRAPMAERFGLLTCLSEPPFADSFRPPYSGPDRPLWRLSDIRPERLAALPLVGRMSDMPGMNDLLEGFARFAVDFIPSWNRDHLAPLTHPRLYGRDVCTEEAVPLILINSDRPLEEKVELLIGLVQRGIDRYGIFRSALAQEFHPWQADGGHNSGRKASILIGGHLLGDAAMLSVMAQSRTVPGRFHEDAMTFHVTAEDVETTNSPDWDPAYPDRPQQPYTTGMIGMPDWRGKGGPRKASASWVGHPYRISGNHNTQHAQVLCLLAMGLREAWGNDAYFDYHMRYGEIMAGRPDPWQRRGGDRVLYDAVTGSRPPGGWEDWQLYWQVPLAWQMLEAYRSRFYSYPWA